MNDDDPYLPDLPDYINGLPVRWTPWEPGRYGCLTCNVSGPKLWSVGMVPERGEAALRFHAYWCARFCQEVVVFDLVAPPFGAPYLKQIDCIPPLPVGERRPHHHYEDERLSA